MERNVKDTFITVFIYIIIVLSGEAGLVDVFVKRTLILCNNLVSAGAEFLEFTIGWDAYDIRRVDFHQNHLVASTRKLGSVLESASVEPVGTANILIIVHLVAWHRQDLSNTVEELASMLVGD